MTDTLEDHLMRQEPLIVSADDLVPEVCKLLSSWEQQIHELQAEPRDAYKRLCKYEGHVPIYDSDGGAWCELCGGGFHE